jgi:hypothetical protein
MPYNYSRPATIYPPPKSKIPGIIILIALFVGIASLVAEISLFRLTFISLPHALTIWAGFSTVAFLLLLRIFQKYYPPTSSLFFLAIGYGIACAGLPLYLFMAANYYFADAKTTTQTYIVIAADNGSPIGKCVEPYIEIEHKGLNKQIIYPCGTVVDKQKSLTLTTSEGFFGYDIIRN